MKFEDVREEIAERLALLAKGSPVATIITEIAELIGDAMPKETEEPNAEETEDAIS